MSLRPIIIVEDEQLLSETMQKVLLAKGFSVRVAPNGEEALKLLRTADTPSLFLVDLMMPKMDGWEFLRELRKIGEQTLLAHRAIVLSGSANAEDIANQEGVGFIAKPFVLAELLDLVTRNCQ